MATIVWKNQDIKQYPVMQGPVLQNERTVPLKRQEYLQREAMDIPGNHMDWLYWTKIIFRIKKE